MYDNGYIVKCRSILTNDICLSEASHKADVFLERHAQLPCQQVYHPRPAKTALAAPHTGAGAALNAVYGYRRNRRMNGI